MSSIRVLLVDDHPVVRLGIRNLLEREEDILVAGEAGDGEEALQLVKELSPDVILLDMEMPRLNGREVVQRLSEQGIPVQVLALSAHDDRQYIQEVLLQGASGYLLKEEVPDTIVEAVRGVARGERGWMSRSIAMQLSDWKRTSQELESLLTPREMDVLRELVTGKTNQEIGTALGISEKTVENYLSRVFQKLKVVSRVDAAVLAVREGLV